MTLMLLHSFRCAVCGKVSKNELLVSTNSTDPPDLDFRPGGMARLTLGFEIYICPHCGYVSYQIDEEVSENVKRYVLSPEYQRLDVKSEFEIYCRTMNAYSAMKEILLLKGDIIGAFWATLKAAWKADDFAKKEEAVAFRKEALSLLAKIKPREMGRYRYKLLTIDLLRRTGDFNKAIKISSKYLKLFKNFKKEISYELYLSQNRLDGCYQVLEDNN